MQQEKSYKSYNDYIMQAIISPSITLKHNKL